MRPLSFSNQYYTRDFYKQALYKQKSLDSAKYFKQLLSNFENGIHWKVSNLSLSLEAKCLYKNSSVWDSLIFAPTMNYFLNQRLSSLFVDCTICTRWQRKYIYGIFVKSSLLAIAYNLCRILPSWEREPYQIK